MLINTATGMAFMLIKQNKVVNLVILTVIHAVVPNTLICEPICPLNYFACRELKKCVTECPANLNLWGVESTRTCELACPYLYLFENPL